MASAWAKPEVSGALEVQYVDKRSSALAVGGRSPDGAMWSLSLNQLIKAIERGEKFYVTTPSETLLLTVNRDGSGKAELAAGLVGDGVLEKLPAFPGRGSRK